MSEVQIRIAFDGIVSERHSENIGFTNFENVTMKELKERIQASCFIPNDCQFYIGVVNPQNSVKELFSDDTDHYSFINTLQKFIVTKGNSKILSIAVYPRDFAVVSCVFTTNDQFPREGLIDFSLMGAFQNYPLLFLKHSWDRDAFLEQLRNSTVNYLISGKKLLARDIPMIEPDDIRVYSLIGHEHILPETISHADNLIIKLRDTSRKIKNLMLLLNWEEIPLINSKKARNEESNSRMFPSDNKIDYSTPVKEVKNCISSSSTLTPQQSELKAKLQDFGVSLSHDAVLKLSDRSSSIEGAINYYLEHPSLFEEIKGEGKGFKNDSVLMHTENLVQASSEMKAEGKSETREEDAFSELDYMATEHPIPIVPMKGPDWPILPPMPPVEPKKTLSNSSNPPAQNSSATQRIKFSQPKFEEYYNQFLAIGIELNELQIQELSLRASTVDGMMNYYFSNQHLFANNSSNYCQFIDQKRAASPEIQRQCLICYEDTSMSEMYQIDCCHNHYFCLDCLFKMIELGIKGTTDSAPCIPACPLANGKDGCKYVLEEVDCDNIIRLSLNLPNKHIVSYHDADELTRRMKKLYLNRAYYQLNCVRCPACPTDIEDHAYWVSLPADGRTKSIRVNCPTCENSFCSSCLRTPYHYGCKCDEVMPYTRAWTDWLVKGREEYVREFAKHEEKYRQSLEEYAKTKQEHDKKIKEAEDRFKEIQQSEKEMARFCKACPHCGYRIEKIDGCDSMVCGRDAHGKPNGLGCGKGFAWSSAPKYQPNIGEKKMPEELKMVKPDKAHEIRHEIVHGMPLPCDFCCNAIIGPLIRCLNCPSTTMCLQCNSSIDFGDKSLADGHNNTHTCKVVFETLPVLPLPDDDEGLVQHLYEMDANHPNNPNSGRNNAGHRRVPPPPAAPLGRDYANTYGHAGGHGDEYVYDEDYAYDDSDIYYDAENDEDLIHG